MNDKIAKELVRGSFAVIVAVITTFGGSYYGLYQPKIAELESTIDFLENENKNLSEKATESGYSLDSNDSSIEEMQGTIDDLMKQLSDAKTENKTLSDANNRLLAENDDLKAKLKVVPSPDDSETPANEENKKPSGGKNLLTECPPYETGGYKSPDLLTIMGVDYPHAFSIHEKGFAYFNLDSKYETFSFDVGHVDGSSLEERKLIIYLSEKDPISIDLSGDMELTHYDVSVAGVNQMKITMNNAAGYPSYGIVNAKLF